jgi:hypothetical protein
VVEGGRSTVGELCKKAAQGMGTCSDGRDGSDGELPCGNGGLLVEPEEVAGPLLMAIVMGE